MLLSDIDGLYTADPRRDPDAVHIPVVETLTPEIEAMGGEPPPGYSSGGMRTKLAAARIATQAGCAMAIAFGRMDRPLTALQRGCTLHVVSAGAGRTIRAQAMDCRCAGTAGSLIIDAGAARALAAGRSLLPAGVRVVEGTFERGDPVVVRRTGRRGAGTRRFLRTAARRHRALPGHRSDEIEAILGWRGRDEMIHRDDLVLL